MTQIDRRVLMAGVTAGTVVSLMPTLTQAQSAVGTAPSIEAYALTPLIDQIALSPDGQRIAIISQKGDIKVLMTFAIADAKPTPIVIGSEKVRDVFWADNASVVVVSSTTRDLPEFSHRSEFTYARKVDIATGNISTFFLQSGGGQKIGSIVAGDAARFYPIVMGRMRRVKNGDEYRVIAANYRIIGDYNLCLYSFGKDSSVGRLVVAGPTDTEDFVYTPQGELVAFSAFDEFRKEWTLVYNQGLGTGKLKTEVIYRRTNEDLNHPSLIGLGHDGKAVVISLIDDKGIVQYYEMSADGALGASLDFENNGIPLFHPVTWQLAGVARQTDSIVYEYSDPLMKKLCDAIPKMVGDGFRSYPVDFADDPRRMIVYSEGDGDAGSYYFIDFSTGGGTQVGSNYPSLPSEWISQKRAISYPAVDGTTIHAYLTLPPFKGDKALPLVVLPHGGPQARDYIGFDWQPQALAAKGYAVLQPNFRGSSGYGEAFVIAGYGEWGRKMQTDLSDGVRYLAAKGTIDPKRVAILGASYGGYAAMAGATLDPGVYNCAVAIAGVSDLKTMITWEDNNTNNQNSTTVQYWKRFMGDPAKWDDVSPARQAAKASCPLLLIHGTDDTVVPIEQSRRMETAMKVAGKPVEFITYKGQDHWESIGSTRITMMTAAVEFLSRYNPA